MFKTLIKHTSHVLPNRTGHGTSYNITQMYDFVCQSIYISPTLVLLLSNIALDF